MSSPACPIPRFRVLMKTSLLEVSLWLIPLPWSSCPPSSGDMGNDAAGDHISRRDAGGASCERTPSKQPAQREIPSSKDALLSYDGARKKMEKWIGNNVSRWRCVSSVFCRVFVCGDGIFFLCVIGWKVWVKLVGDVGMELGNGVFGVLEVEFGTWWKWSLGIEGVAKGAWSVKAGIE